MNNFNLHFKEDFVDKGINERTGFNNKNIPLQK